MTFSRQIKPFVVLGALAVLSTGSTATALAATPPPAAVTAPTVTVTNNQSGLYTLDAFGGVHPAGAAVPVATTAYWPGWDIARGIVTRPDHQSGYVLDGFGGIHPFGGAPDLAPSAYWPGWDIARGIALAPNGTGGWVLDGFGGLHPFGNAPQVGAPTYWRGWDIARGIAADATGSGGWVLDGFGGLHAFGDAAPMAPSAYWPGWDIARSIAPTPSGGGGYVLDGFGGLHPFGDAGPVTGNAYWPGWDIARGVVTWTAAPSGQPGGWVVDGWGALHAFGSAPLVTAHAVWPGWNIVRGLGGGDSGSRASTVSSPPPPPPAPRPVAGAVVCSNDPVRDTAALTAAIDGAPANSRVVIGAGTCALDSNLPIHQPLTIDGAGPQATFLVQHGSTNIFQVTSPYVTVENVNLDTATYNPGPMTQQNPMPAVLFSDSSHTSILNVTARSGDGFGLRITGPNPCATDQTVGTVVDHLDITNSGTGGFAALDIDCTNGAQLSNITVHGDYIALYQDANVLLNGEAYTPDAGPCQPPWYITGPASGITVEQVGGGGNGIVKGVTSAIVITGQTPAPGC